MLNSLDLEGAPDSIRVVVAMSGGVDSSVVAALLARAGYQVIGATLQLYDHGEATGRKGACCAGRDIQDASRVAETLGIPHYVLDYEERFRKSVIESFADSYARGETPVPCVACNQTVKFSDLLAMARTLGADALATGHYVESRRVGGRRALFRPADAERDQSYFLFATTQEQLDYVRFPLGGMSKDEVRRLAHAFGLSVAGKSDSQDICFVPDGHYARIVEKLRPEAARAGPIVHLDGRVLGRHDGVIRFTVGQRRGLGLSIGEPLYVVSIDADAARVVVGPREALKTSTIALRDLNWIGPELSPAVLAGGVEVFARVRSTRPPVLGVLQVGETGAHVRLCASEEGVAPGQACVLYDSGAPRARVLGGGWISAADSVPAGPAAAGAHCMAVPA